MPSFSILTLGCRANQADAERLRQILVSAGFVEHRNDKDSDVAIVSTCTVTAEADRKSRQMLRRCRRKAAIVVAAGCGVAARGGLSELGEEYLRLAPEHPEQILELLASSGLVVSSPPAQDDKPVRQRHTRALLKIQEGCDHFCTYCIVPYVRGRSRSVAASKVVEQAQALAKQGALEIVLTGIHLAMWGLDLPEKSNLAELLQMLVDNVPGPRFRLSSIEPMSFPRRLIDIMANNPARVCPHLHLALQHASNTVLQRMHRDYTIEEYDELAARFRNEVAGAVLTTDVLVGFPGETEGEFAELMAYLGQHPYYHLHVFGYSQRPGTAAALLPNQVPAELKKARVEAVNTLGEQLKQEVLASFRGQCRPVLAEVVGSKPGWLKGTADNFISAQFPGSPSLLGTIVEVRL